MSSSPKMTLDRLRAFDEAWGNKDIDTLMEFMTDDCEYHASVGPEPGRRFVGKVAVREGFQLMFAHDADGEARGGPAFISGNQGVTEWSYVVTDDHGRRSEVRGCDIFEFVGDKIRRKDAFRKCLFADD
ncbi:MAG: nuclear transport factor 2 family protein [Woeseiaceae bacterium]